MMTAPKERIAEAIETWQRETAREQIARWRQAPDALSEEALAERHEALRGPRLRDLFLEQVERGAIAGDERAAIASWLREAHAALGHAPAEARLREALLAPVPYDSDHHRGIDLALRLAETPGAKHRRAIAKALEATWAETLAARRTGRAQIEEARDAASWLEEEAPHPDAVEIDGAEAILESTDEAWRELSERLAHAAKVQPEHWTDLLHALRAPRWDDLVPPTSRWRRLADRLGGLGLAGPLAKRARAEPRGDGLRARVVVITPRQDVRVCPGPELGLASERDSTIALGYAAATLLAHPGLPHVLARPLHGSVPFLIGYLFAHLAADPVFSDRVHKDLAERERRPLVELALGHELFELRTLAAVALCRSHLDTRDLGDASQAYFTRAWGTPVSPRLAATLAHEPSTEDRFRAARWAPALHVALRDRWDEDFWRNPRAAEPIRNACERGATLSVEAWMEELSVDDGALGRRMTELLA